MQNQFPFLNILVRVFYTTPSLLHMNTFRNKRCAVCGILCQLCELWVNWPSLCFQLPHIHHITKHSTTLNRHYNTRMDVEYYELLLTEKCRLKVHSKYNISPDVSALMEKFIISSWNARKNMFLSSLRLLQHVFRHKKQYVWGALSR